MDSKSYVKPKEYTVAELAQLLLDKFPHNHRVLVFGPDCNGHDIICQKHIELVTGADANLINFRDSREEWLRTVQAAKADQYASVNLTLAQAKTMGIEPITPTGSLANQEDTVLILGVDPLLVSK